MPATATKEQYSWYDAPPEVKELLILASENWDNTELSEQYINQALAIAGKNANVLIGAYRFFFYKSKAAIALQIAERVVNMVREDENLPIEWEELKPILVTRGQEPAIRLFINAYAGTGYLLAKLNRLEEALLITSRIKEIDSKREFCATTVFEVLTAEPEADD
jgi:tetratricopeptide (TPR) repeat protein